MNGYASLFFKCPPIPYIIACGTGSYEAEDAHISRQNIEVFDLIVVFRGTLYLCEDGPDITIKEGCSVILRPDLYHYSTKNCEETTSFYWVHFQTAGGWEESYEDSDRSLKSFTQPYDLKLYNKDVFKTYSYNIHIPKLHKLPYPSNTYNKLNQILSLEYISSPSARWQQQSYF